MAINPISKKQGFRLSIPVKVVIFTGLVYTALWATGLLMERIGLISLSGTFLGMKARTVYTAIEIVIVAFSATLGTHAFLDRPLKRLANVMSRAEEGDFLVRAPVLSNDELGQLARTFNRMLSRITDLAANKIQADHDLMMAQEQLKFRRSIEEKNSIIERTNRTLERLVKDLSLIYEIGQEVNSIIDLEKLYTNITEALKRYLRISQFAILVFDDKREELHVKAAYGFVDEDAIFHTTFCKGEGITGLVAETGRKIYIRDTTKEERFLNYKSEKPVERSSFLSIPLVYKGEMQGVINFSRLGANSFSYQDVRMMSLVAGQVAIAIANARLYTRTRELSVKDELTGINNRRYFQQMLQMEWKRAVRFGRQLSLIMIDVDHFKIYNDTFGHMQGDLVLKRIGELLKRNLREVDTVARFGGEEFVLLLPDTDKRGAIAVAEKVRVFVEAYRFATEDHHETRPITISAGIACFPGDVSEMDDLIDRADIALYRAKENGRNRVECYAPFSKDEDETEIIPEPEEVLNKATKKTETLQ